MAKRREGYYGVREGRIRGVYKDWASCRAQVDKCANQYRRFDTYDEAAFYVATGQTRRGEDGEALFVEWRRTQQPSPRASSAEKKTIVKQEKPRVKDEPFDASQSYFSQIPNFEPDVKADFDEEFGRFASSQNIAPCSKVWRKIRTNAIRHEMMFHYSQDYGSDGEGDVKEEDDDDLGRSNRQLWALQNMCREVGLEPLDTIDGCVSNLKSVLVNIIDYIDARRNARPIKVWDPSEFEDFRKYTLSPGKRIDLEEAKSGDGFVFALLQVLNCKDAALVYQSRRDRAVIVREDYVRRVSGKMADQKPEQRLEVIKEEPSTPSTPSSTTRKDCTVISIHGTESECSSPRPIKEEVVPWSPSSMGSSVIEILINFQEGTKRSLDDSMEDDTFASEDSPTRPHKRFRIGGHQKATFNLELNRWD
ncbi:hypothetical protein F4802DRAFT_559297 [Xylaria palmicola]|nr:hypothetical protein F4802DRAFT_559297 [Xylaria palmicola]